MYKSIALFDVSYSIVRNYKVRASNTNASPQEVAQGALLGTLAEMAACRESVEHVVLCLDAPPYFRSDLYPEYKGQRPRQDPELTAIKRTLLERIEQDGYSVARVPSFEADDVIATLCHLWHPMCPDIRIVSADKDAAQCVRLAEPNLTEPHEVRMFVPAVSGRPEEIRGPAEVKQKFGVEPQHMALYLALCGDKADGIPGVPKWGPVTASHWINETGGDLLKLGVELAKQSELGPKMPMLWKHFASVYEQIPLWVRLTTLRCDVPIDADALLVKRKVQPLVEVSDADDSEFIDLDEERALMTSEDVQEFIPFGNDATLPSEPQKTMTFPNSEPPEYTHDVHGNKLPKAPAASAARSVPSVPATPVTTAEAKVVPPTQGPRKVAPIPSDGAMVRVAPPSWALSAQPNTPTEMLAVATTLMNGRFLAHYGTPEGVYTVMALGRELGLGYMAALEGFHIVGNRPWPRAKMLKALAESDPNCVWMQITSSDEKHATIKTEHRKAGLLEYTYTAERARKAGYFDGKNGFNWKTKTIEMLEARAMSKAAGRWYPGATMGLHSFEEMQEEE